MSGKYLLAGNGINMQYGQEEYSSQQIVLRILKNCDSEDFPADIVIDEPFLLKHYMGKLFLEAREMVNGKYDCFTTCTAEKESLEVFKKKYKHDLLRLRIPDVCFEDYYLVHDLLCHKLKVQNPEQYNIREAMRVAYLFAIYNHGALNELYHLYTNSFVDYICSFDKVFTTNYDTNIEKASEKTVIHLHGSFEVLGDVYDADSLRNYLPDAPLLDSQINDEFRYLYCNALTTHCGEYKDFMIHQYSQANGGVRKLAEAYQKDPEMKTTIDSWAKDGNRLLANLGRAVQVVVVHPHISFKDNYHFDEFESMDGALDVLGLSPQNDNHIFHTIDNSNVSKCTYYYFSESEIMAVKSQLRRLDQAGQLQFVSVKEFWKAHE